MSAPIMLSVFDKTTVMAQPWAAAGYVCYCVDIQHPAGVRQTGNIVYVGADVREWLPPRGDIAFAAFFPPCTDVAVSGARWFKDKGIGALVAALQLFDVSVKLAEWTGAPYLIENPVGTVSTRRKPVHFASLGRLHPALRWHNKPAARPQTSALGPRVSVIARVKHMIRRAPVGADRADLRSATPAGFARAVFEANSRA